MFKLSKSVIFMVQTTKKSTELIIINKYVDHIHNQCWKEIINISIGKF